MPLIIQKEWITAKQMAEQSDVWFVFGDNQRRVGYGGQAKIMRGKPNALGVATCKMPGHPLSDKDRNDFQILAQDLARVESFLFVGEHVVFPGDGIGTGLASMPTDAPKLFAFLEATIERWKATYGIDE